MCMNTIQLHSGASGQHWQTAVTIFDLTRKLYSNKHSEALDLQFPIHLQSDMCPTCIPVRDPTKSWPASGILAKWHLPPCAVPQARRGGPLRVSAPWRLAAYHRERLRAPAYVASHILPIKPDAIAQFHLCWTTVQRSSLEPRSDVSREAQTQSHMPGPGQRGADVGAGEISLSTSC